MAKHEKTGVTAARRLSRAVGQGKFVVAPGCYDALSARVAELHGFEAVYMSGLAVTAALLARPDLELLGMAEMVRQAALISSAVDIPIIADADTGYGGLANVERTVEGYMQAGVAAIHIEDQTSPKRCGHLGGIKLIDDAAMMAKLEVAMATRGRGDMLVIGRTDGFKADNLDEGIRRAKLYAQSGVDVLFVNGLTEPDDFKKVRQSLEGPLMASIVEIDAPALTKADLLRELGYSIAVYALSSIQATAGALDGLMANIRGAGSTDASFERMMTYSDLNEKLGIARFHDLWNRHSKG